MKDVLDRLGTMLPPGSRVLCAVSGGADSMCLLHLLWSRRQALELTVLAAHFHHGLRGEPADRDAAFVTGWCRERGILCAWEQGDTAAYAREQGLTPEEAGRALRYAFLERIAREQEADFIAVAHHREDSAETLLINLCRGTGLAGLGGIPLRRGKLIRPLLTVSRQQIEDYLAQNGISYVTDETNREAFAARNVLRQEVLPVLETLWPDAQARMARTALLLRQENEALEQWAQTLIADARQTDNALVLPCRAFQTAPQALRPRMALQMLDRLGAGRKDVGWAHLTELAALTQTGGQLNLPGGVLAWVEGERLYLERRPPLPQLRPLAEGESMRFGPWQISRGAQGNLCLACGTEAVLTVGPWRPRDRMTTAQSRGSRSLKRLFADAGVSPRERESLPVFYVDDVPAAVWGVGVDTGFLPRPRQPCLRLEIRRAEEEEPENNKNPASKKENDRKGEQYP